MYFKARDSLDCADFGDMKAEEHTGPKWACFRTMSRKKIGPEVSAGFS